MTDLRIGCSGWTYDHWKGSFYPAGLPKSRWFDFYAERFDTCELNGSFYRLPSENAVRSWAERAPAGFLYAWKVSRFISHNKKLNDCRDSIDLVFGRMAPLGEKQGPALVQLPPMLHRDDERLARFLSWLPRTPRCAVEFRHPSWYEPAVLDILRDHGAALVISDHHDAPAPWEVTADFVYWRGHGPGGRYVDRYPKAELDRLAHQVTRWRQGRHDVFAYFDNDIKTAAPADAEALRLRICGQP